MDAYDLLLPAPRAINRGDARLRSPAPHAVSADPTLPPGGYRLELRAETTTLFAADDAGTRHARATLAQLTLAARHAPLPEAVVTDAPAIARRGVMLDVSRTRVPRNDELHRLVTRFASLKLNHLQLYTEHAFAYAGHEPIWRGTSPITPDELRRLDATCAPLGIELAANQNCFGHLTRWLRHPDYAHLAETHAEWSFAGMPRSGPFSLCPTDPASLAFVESLLDQLLPCLRSSFVNIGCDETDDVGTGRSRDAVATLGKGRVYADFVASVCRAALVRGKTPMFWGDIAAQHPESVDRLPTEAIALVWGYEPSSDFAAQARAHTERDRPWWACPGTSSWRSFTGRTHERRRNIRRAAHAAAEHHADGLLVTDWGDLGHHQTRPIALMGIAEAADAAWTGRDRSPHFLDAVSLHVFGDPTGATARWLEALGDADEPIRAIAGRRASDGSPTRLLNASALFTELHPPPTQLALPAHPAPWRDTLSRLDELAGTVPASSGPLVTDELHHALACARFAARVAIARRTEPDPALPNDLEHVIRTHRRLWHIRSRPGGLDESGDVWRTIALQ